MDDSWVAELLDDGEVAALLTHLTAGEHDDGQGRERLRQLLEARRAAGEPAIYPLSWNQTSLWYLHELAPAAAAYHVGGAMQFRNQVDLDVFARAVQGVADRHAALRTTFTTIAGRPFQVVHDRMETPVVHVDASGMTREELIARVQRDYEEPIDLRQGPGLKLTLYHGHGRPVWLVRIHHALMDLWSLAVVFYDLGQLYAAELRGEQPALHPPGAQYPEFVRWQRELLATEAGHEQGRYWEQQLAGMPQVLDLPTDRPRPAMQSLRGRAVRFAVDAEPTKALGKLARTERASFFVLLLAAFQTLLHRVTGQDDFGIGVPVAGRGQAQHRDMVGHCVNMAVLRGQFTHDPTFRDLLADTGKRVKEAMRNEDYPFAHVVHDLGVVPDQSRPPLFQTSLVYQQSPLIDMSTLVFDVVSEDRPVDLGGLVLDPFPVAAQQGQFDLSLWAGKVGGALHGDLKLDAALFDEATGHRMAEQFQQLLRGIVAGPDRPISKLPLMDDSERHRILHDWNDTARPYPRDRRIPQLFEEQAARTPDAVAVTSTDSRLTYAELEERANRLAHHLRAMGVGPGKLVAVLIDRTPDTVVALLGILKAGGGYVPLEAHYPRARVEFILGSLGIAVVLTQSAHLARLGELDAPDLQDIVCLEAAGIPPDATVGPVHVWSWEDVLRQPPTRPEPAGASPDDTAYVIFTSGSTGTPKGVSVRHRPVVNLIDWVNRTYAVGPGDRLLFITSLSFDLSVYDVFGALAGGATIRIASRDEIQDPRGLTRLLCEDGITIWDSAPPALNQLVPFLPPSAPDSPLRLVLLSGDWIPVKLPDQVRDTFPRAQVVSLGGATEATIWSNSYDIGVVDPTWPSIPYGRPIQNARYYILDRAHNPCPIGVPGDLYIGGEVLADGYVNDPDLTAAKFVSDPFVDDPDARMYDTGDRARFLPDGNIQFLGRRDFQVKIRGFRIELGEIEAVLGDHPDVADCVVVARDEGGDRHLVAYVVSSSPSAPSAAQLRTFLLERLPEFMVPQHFVTLQQLPLTPNGKLDRKALPVPERRREDLLTEYVAPATDLERAIVDVWKDVLAIDRVGVTDSFYDLGGDSLAAVRVVYEIEQRMGRVVPVSALLRAPSVRELAGRLEAGVAEEASVLVPLRDGVAHPPLFLFHPSGGDVVAYRGLVTDVDPERPMTALRSFARTGAVEADSLAAMAKEYAEVIRAAQPDGPYLLAGWSLGGVLAHAVAGHLERGGATVALCAIIDSVLPASRSGLRDRLLYRLGTSLGPLAGGLASQPEEVLEDLLARPPGERLEAALQLARTVGDATAELPPSVLEPEIELAARHAQLLEAHQPDTIAAPVRVIWAEHSTDAGAPLTDWSVYTRGGVEQTVLAGANHFTIWRSPHREALCAELDAAVRTAAAGSARTPTA